MNENQLEVLRDAVGSAMSEMSEEELRHLVVGPYLNIREGNQP